MSDQHDAGAIAGLSFEAALARLEKLVAELETGDVALERAIALYSEGAALKRHCEAKLGEARMRVEKITLDEEGKAKATTPLDSQ